MTKRDRLAAISFCWRNLVGRAPAAGRRPSADAQPQTMRISTPSPTNPASGSRPCITLLIRKCFVSLASFGDRIRVRLLCSVTHPVTRKNVVWGLLPADSICLFAR